MTEIHFIVEEAPEGGFTARAVGAGIFTEADDLPGLHAQVRDAVRCHFGEDGKPGVIRLHITSRFPITTRCVSAPWHRFLRRLPPTMASVATNC
ncbi:MAG: hypothetical protein Q8L93_10455 [Rhodocyclaceae bacterium]|nr:hypothetical protein [Rhodocyclaceae bacterium]